MYLPTGTEVISGDPQMDRHTEFMKFSMEALPLKAALKP